ncbi:MAG: hypothetical protein J6U93_01985 [Alistipes sp.]|nr:hypothetical protein [Alistipes sp.]
MKEHFKNMIIAGGATITPVFIGGATTLESAFWAIVVWALFIWWAMESNVMRNPFKAEENE